MDKCKLWNNNQKIDLGLKSKLFRTFGTLPDLILIHQ